MNQETTLEELASMIAAGFSDVKEDVATLRSDVDAAFLHVRASLRRIENRQNAVEDRTIADHERRITRLEGQSLRT